MWWEEAGEVVSALSANGHCTIEWAGGSHLLVKRQQRVTGGGHSSPRSHSFLHNTLEQLRLKSLPQILILLYVPYTRSYRLDCFHEVDFVDDIGAAAQRVLTCLS